MTQTLNEGQIKILKTEGNILVNASAGSGKTSTMINKIMQYLLSGVDIRKILVITFTKAAAEEMRARLIKKIYEELRKNSKNYSLMLNQLNNMPFGNVCTIDSFCYGIFQKYFALTGRDPSCSVLEPADAFIMLGEVIEEVCEEHIEKNDERFLALARRFSQGRRLDEVKNIIFSLYDFIISQPDTDEMINNIFLSEESIFEKCAVYLRKYFDRKTALLINTTYNYLQSIHNAKFNLEIKHTQKILNGLQALSEIVQLKNALENLIAICGSQPCEKGKKGDEINRIISNYYAVLKEYNSEFSLYLSLLNSYSKTEAADAKILIDIVLKVKQKYQSRKEHKNSLDFGDLKHLTLEILKNDKAQKEIKSNLDYIFVDEYQDTDSLQEILISKICEENNVFTVGDIKQSIYRFRYAEPAIFNKRMRRYQNLKTGENIPLSINYRSDKRILDFVNAVCLETMTSEFCDIDYKEGGILESGKDFEIVNEEPACAVYTYIEDRISEKKHGYYSVKNDESEKRINIEGAFIAKKINEMVSSLYIDGGNGNIKKLNYSDIAVLVSKRTIYSRFISEFEKKGIPYKLDNENLIKDENREVLVDFIRLLTNMAQDIPLANVLLSGMSNFTLQELLEIPKNNPKNTFWESFTTYSGNQTIENKILEFSSLLEEYRFKASYMKVSDLLVEIIGKGFDAYLMSKGGQAIERINSFIHFISGSSAENSIEDFINFYDNVYQGHKSEYGNNAVTVTTIHKSKGLEYPIVFIAGADIGSVGGDVYRQKIFADKELGIAIKTFDDDTYSANDNFCTSVFKLKVMQEEREELARLLYVAMTRAQNHLIITGKVSKNEKTKDLYSVNSFMDLLLYAKQNSGALAVYWNQITDLFEDKEIAEIQTNEIIKQEKVCLDCLQMKYPYEKSARSPAKYSVSELSSLQGGEIKKLIETSDADTGTRYHTILQYIDYGADNREKISKEISRMVDEGILTKEESEKIDMKIIENVLNSDIIRYAKISKTYREQAFMLYTDCPDGQTKLDDKVLVQGIIDLIIVGEKIILVDFKSSFGDKEYIKQKYSRQLEIYAKSAEKVFNLKPDKKILFNILQNYIVEI